MSSLYRLEGHTPILEPNIYLWGPLFEDAEKRKVGRDEIGDAVVSTMFLGMDHNMSGAGPPVLFETMIFWDGHELDEEQERYCTWEEAEAGHARWVAAVRAAQQP